MTPEPFCRESGTGQALVCLHANASSSSQWRQLMESLALRCHVMAPDTHGAGKGPAWPVDRPLSVITAVPTRCPGAQLPKCGLRTEEEPHVRSLPRRKIHHLLTVPLNIRALNL